VNLDSGSARYGWAQAGIIQIFFAYICPVALPVSLRAYPGN